MFVRNIHARNVDDSEPGKGSVDTIRRASCHASRAAAVDGRMNGWASSSMKTRSLLGTFALAGVPISDRRAAQMRRSA